LPGLFSTAYRVLRNVGLEKWHNTEFCIFLFAWCFSFKPWWFLFLFFLQIFFSNQIICQIACLFREGVALNFRQGIAGSSYFPIHYHSRLFTGNKVSGVDDTELKDMEFFYREMREDLRNKKIKWEVNRVKVNSFFLRMIVVFFLVLIFTVRFSLSHILGGFFMPN